MIDRYDTAFDSQVEEEMNLEDTFKPPSYDFSDAKRLKRNAKINEQPPLVQLYWLGRLCYEFAIRNDKVKHIMQECSKLNNKIDFYDDPEISKREKCLKLKLDKFGFSNQLEDDVLRPEHTSYPARLKHHYYGYIEINTRKKIEQLFLILDGETAKKLNMNTNAYKKWKSIGEAYINGGYIELLSLEEYADSYYTTDYMPIWKTVKPYNIKPLPCQQAPFFLKFNW